MDQLPVVFPGEVTLHNDPRGEAKFLDKYGQVIAVVAQYCGRDYDELIPPWFEPADEFERLVTESGVETRWMVRVGGMDVGLAEIYKTTTALYTGPIRIPKLVHDYHFRMFLLPRSHNRRIGVLACIEALALFWDSPETAAAPVDIKLNGWQLNGWRTPPATVLDEFEAIFGEGECGIHTVTLQGVCAFLWKCRRALAWAFVRATRQASPHPFAAFLRRNPGLLHVVGRRVLAFWSPAPDPYACHCMARVYPVFLDCVRDLHRAGGSLEDLGCSPFDRD